MTASICANPERLQRRNPRLGLLVVVSSAALFYGAIAAYIWHFL
jgi:hypothetical protein